MIYTVTLNPALDYNVALDEIIPGKTNYMDYGNFTVGGKGINISRVLSTFNVNSRPMGFLAGRTGKIIESNIKEIGFGGDDWIYLSSGESRVNIKIRTYENETEINAKGPDIDSESFSRLIKKLNEAQKDDIVVLAGSIPQSLPASTYEIITEMLGRRGVKVCVDAAGSLLKNTLKNEPLLIKPNLQELEGMFNIEIVSRSDVLKYAHILQKRGAQNVVVSLGSDGAVMVTKDEEYTVSAPRGAVKSTVGSGDSMLAGLIYGYINGYSPLESLKYGVAAGSATAFSNGLADSFDYIMKIYSVIK